MREKPLRIAAIVSVTADLSDFTTDALADGTLYRVAIQSPGALGMGLNFKKYSLPAGATMFIYSEKPGTVRGSFTAENHKHYGGLSVMPVVGDTAVVELFVPAGASGAKLELESIAHHYKNTMVCRRRRTPAATHNAHLAALAAQGMTLVRHAAVRAPCSSNTASTTS